MQEIYREIKLIFAYSKYHDVKNYYMPKKSWPILYSKFPYKMGQDFLNI